MATQNTVFGIYNYPVPLSLYGAGAETSLYAPTAANQFPSLPSPLFPLSTATYPVVLWIGPGNDITGGELDGHPFDLKIAGKITAPAAGCTLIMNVYQATRAVLTSLVNSTTYATLTTQPPSGTGINEIATGASGGALTANVSTNFVFTIPLIWDSTSTKLCFTDLAMLYQKGVSIVATNNTAATTVSSFTDLNFFPTFNFTTAVPTSLTITEFVINRR
jgi:hypothetical protein